MLGITLKHQANKPVFSGNSASRELQQKILNAVVQDERYAELHHVLKILSQKGSPPSVPPVLMNNPFLLKPLAKMVYPDKQLMEGAINQVANNSDLTLNLLKKVAELFENGSLYYPQTFDLKPEPPPTSFYRESKPHQTQPSLRPNVPPPAAYRKPSPPPNNYPPRESSLPTPRSVIDSDVFTYQQINQQKRSHSVQKKSDKNSINPSIVIGTSLAATAALLGFAILKPDTINQEMAAPPPTTELYIGNQAAQTAPTELIITQAPPTTFDIPSSNDAIFRTSATPTMGTGFSTVSFENVENRKITDNTEYNRLVNRLEDEYEKEMTRRVSNSSISYDTQKVSTLQTEFNQAVAQFKDTRMLHDYYTGIQKAVEVMMTVTPQRQTTNREIWIGKKALANANSPEAIRKLVLDLKQSNYTRINVEAIGAGYASYPSEFYELNPRYANRDFDAFGLFVQEAHAQGLKVNAWVWCFAATHEADYREMNIPADDIGPLLRNNPQLKPLTTTSGNRFFGHEYWLDPAEDVNRQFLKEAYRELLTKYGVDGLILDYVRYPFNEEGQPVRGKNPEMITRFVNEIEQMANEVNPEIKIAAAVFPMQQSSRVSNIAQNWEAWLDTIDILYPMTYDDTLSAFRSSVSYVQGNADGHKAEVIPIIGMFNKSSSLDIVDHMDAIPNSYSLFAFEQMQEVPENFKVSNIGASSFIEF